MTLNVLDGMTWDKWQRLPRSMREKFADYSDLTPQLVPYLGDRVEVVTLHGETRRFWVGQSTGWKPCHIEVKTSRSHGGLAADERYASVRLVRRGSR